MTVVAVPARCYRVSGRVQGVGYRAAACARAGELGLHGWVRNLPDGRVEAWAEGTAAALADFEAWLAQGPAFARVTGVESRAVDSVGLQGFTIR